MNISTSVLLSLAWLFLLHTLTASAIGQNIKNIDAYKVGSDEYRNLGTGNQGFQCQSPQAKWLLIVAFDTKLDEIAKAETTTNYTIVDLALLDALAAGQNGQPAAFHPLEAKLFPTADRASVGLCIAAEMVTPKDSLLSNQYQVKVRNLTFIGIEEKPDALKSMTLAAVQFRVTTDLPPRDAAATGIKLEAVDNPDNSDLRFDGELRSSSGSALLGAVEVDLGYPIVRNDLDTIKPFFSLKASGDPQNDPDSLKLGISWKRQLLDFSQNSPLMRLHLTNEGAIEAERDFDTANLLWAGRLTLQSKRKATFPLWFDPFVGVELGRNLRSPLPQAEDKGLARLVFGIGLQRKVKVKSPYFDSLSFESHYERRVLLLNEIGIEEDDHKKLTAIEFGKRPRDWIDAKLVFNFKPYWGFYLGYEYGELPPAYKLVDHRFRIGISFRAIISKE